jgi:hypothetical protein
MNTRLTAVALVAPLFCGCASQIGAFFNRPVVQDQVPGAVSTFAQSADRRTVIVSIKEGSVGRFCAEPPPDTATGLVTDLQASLESQAKTLKLGDKLQTSVSVLADRTANLDAFRTGVYALCQFSLNGVLNDADLKELFAKLADNFAKVEAVAAAAPSATRPAAAASAVN